MDCHVKVYLNSLVDPNCTVQAVVASSSEDDSYIIKYTPRVRGRHDLVVKVNQEDIIGSPFRVFVTLHPTNLGRPINTIKSHVTTIYGIAINNEQQLVVVSQKKIIVMEHDGREVHVIECTEFQNPNKAAVGEDGVIYGMAHCLFKFSKYGELMCYTSQIIFTILFFLILFTVTSLYQISIKSRYLI